MRATSCDTGCARSPKLTPKLHSHVDTAVLSRENLVMDAMEENEGESKKIQTESKSGDYVALDTDSVTCHTGLSKQEAI